VGDTAPPGAAGLTAESGQGRAAGDGPVRATDLGVVVNGSTRPLTPGATVADLVSAWCASPDGIAVARNREVVPRSEWATTPLSPRDVVEIVTAAAGG
jgi:sulfur carrier protein